jgi:hypothetical protein
MARANKVSTKPAQSAGRQHRQPEAQGAGGKAKKRLRVAADHKTGKMRERHRGTFP